MKNSILRERFYDSLDRKYVESRSNENTSISKISLALFIVLLTFYGIIKYYFIGTFSFSRYIIEYALYLVPMIIVFITTFTKFGCKYIALIMPSLLIYLGAYISYQIIVSEFDLIHYIGLSFIFFSIYALLNLGAKATHVTGWSITIIYFLIYALINQDFSLNFVSNSILLIGINGVGILSYYYRENRQLENYLNYLDSKKENSYLYDDMGDLKSKLHDSKESLTFTIENLLYDIDEDFGSYIKRIKAYTKVIASSYAVENLPDEKQEDFIENIYYAVTFHKLNDFLNNYSNNLPDYSKSVLGRTIQLYPKDDIISFVSNIENSYNEFFDGSGSPFGLSGGNIPIEARIVCAVNLYDEFTTSRDSELDHFQSLAELESCSGSIIDPYVYDLFIENSTKLEDLYNNFFALNQGV